MIPYDLIRKKQQGRAHTPEEIRFLVDAFTDGSLPGGAGPGAEHLTVGAGELVRWRSGLE